MAQYDGAKFPKSMPGRADTDATPAQVEAQRRALIAVGLILVGCVVAAFGVHSLWGSGATTLFVGTMVTVLGVLIGLG